MSEEFSAIRADFPMLAHKMNGHPLIYFDNAVTALKPRPVIECLTEFYAECYGSVHRGVYALSQEASRRYHEVRIKTADFIGALPEEVIFTSGTTESINLAAASFAEAFLEEGDEILVSVLEHHANIIPWQRACALKKGVLRVIPVSDEAVLDLEALEGLLTDKTKLVALTHVSNAFGIKNPVKEIIRLIRKKSHAKVLIDGAQSIPHQIINVKDMDADFFVFSAHKCYGPTGMGVLHGKKELLEALPPYQTGGDMVDTVTFERTTYRPLPHRFEAGTPNVAGVLGWGAALDYLRAADRVAFREREKQLTHYASDLLREEKGVRILGDFSEKGPIIGFTVEGVHSLDIATLLDLRGVAIRSGHHCAQPLLRRFGLSSSLRISFSFYNTFQEIDRFILLFREALRQLR